MSSDTSSYSSDSSSRSTSPSRSRHSSPPPPPPPVSRIVQERQSVLPSPHWLFDLLPSAWQQSIPNAEALLLHVQEKLMEDYRKRNPQTPLRLLRVERQSAEHTTAYVPDLPDISPYIQHVFKAFELTTPEEVRVVVVGQDPLADPKEAQGAAFLPVPDATEAKPKTAIHTIVKALQHDHRKGVPTLDWLRHWAARGVLLINSTLLVHKPVGNKRNSYGKLWRPFTDAVISSLAEQRERRLVFMLWGRVAERKQRLIKDRVVVRNTPELKGGRTVLVQREVGKKVSITYENNEEVWRSVEGDPLRLRESRRSAEEGDAKERPLLQLSTEQQEELRKQQAEEEERRAAEQRQREEHFHHVLITWHPAATGKDAEFVALGSFAECNKALRAMHERPIRWRA